MGTINDLIKVKKLSVIATDGGDVMHALKSSDQEYVGFGELYYSLVNFQSIKGWKLHKKMTMNLTVPFGSVKFVFFSETHGDYFEIEVGKDNYSRITVSPGVWFSFQGKNHPYSIVSNVADIVHDKDEVMRVNLENINYKWN